MILCVMIIQISQIFFVLEDAGGRGGSMTNFHLLIRFPSFACIMMTAFKFFFYLLDLSAERNTFWEKAYPELQSYCQSLGLVFEVRIEY